METVKVELGDDAMRDGTPLKNVSEYFSADVLCGRGGGTHYHPGNCHWRALVKANKRLYISLPKKKKVLVAKSIVHAVRLQTPGGRFLQKGQKVGLWNDIGDQKAIEKTGQALREGAPNIRTEMDQEQWKGNAMVEPMGEVVGAGNYPKPGQILPNGLITLAYEGVLAAQQKSANEPLEDGTIELTHPVLPTRKPAMPSAQQLQLSQAMNPMMQAFQQFIGAKTQHQGQGTEMLPFQEQHKPTPASTVSTSLQSSLSIPLPDSKTTATSTQLETKTSKESHHKQPPHDNSLKHLSLRRSLDDVGTQARTESHPLNNENENTPSSSILGKENIFLYDGLSEITQAQTRASTTTLAAALGGGVSHGMNLQTLLEENSQKVQKAMDNVVEAKFNKTLGGLGLTGLPQMFSPTLGSLERNDAPAAPLPLPTLGDGSSMSDEAIREMLHSFDSQSTSPLRTGAPDTYDLSRLIRNPSPSGALGAGGGLSSLADPLSINSLPPLGSQAHIDKLASQYTGILAENGGRLSSKLHPPPLNDSSSLASTIAAAVSLGGTESSGLSQAIHDAVCYLGKTIADPVNPKASESLHPTPTLEQMKMTDLEWGTAGALPPAASSMNRKWKEPVEDVNGRVSFCRVPTAAAGDSGGTHAPAFEIGTGAVLAECVEMASAPQHGLSCGSLEGLCLAVGLGLSPGQKPAQPEKGKRKSLPDAIDLLASLATLDGSRGSGSTPTTSSMTSAPQHGLSCASLEGLCLAAGLGLSPGQKPAQPGTGKRKSLPDAVDLLAALATLDESRGSGSSPTTSGTRQPKKKKGCALSRKMKAFQVLMDSKYQAEPKRRSRLQISQPKHAPPSRSRWAPVEWENGKKKRVAAVGMAMEGGQKPGKNDQSLVDDSDNEGDPVRAVAGQAPLTFAGMQQFRRGARHSSKSNESVLGERRRNTALSGNAPDIPQRDGAGLSRRACALPVAEAALDKGQSSSHNKSVLGEGRESATLGGNAPYLPRRGGAGLFRGTRALPIAEKVLDQGHSLTMSEISHDRGRSVSACTGMTLTSDGGDEGQFDDANEDESEQ